MAQSFDHSRKGTIAVTLASKNPEQPMVGAELSVYYVATVSATSDGTLFYSFSDHFSGCDFSLEDPELVQKLNDYVSTHTVAGRKLITDSQGKAVCGELPLGLYFIMQTGEAEGFAPCAPFLVTVPMQTNSGYQYHVDASPKTDVEKYTDITIRKVWNTGSSSGIPLSVTVQLLRGSEVVETATLNSQNNWQITYRDMPESDRYSIKETNIPTGFTATYSQQGFVFTVTNTPALAQTGQVIWPIPVFALAGIVFLMVGFVILRKPGKQNA